MQSGLSYLDIHLDLNEFGTFEDNSNMDIYFT